MTNKYDILSGADKKWIDCLKAYICDVACTTDVDINVDKVSNGKVDFTIVVKGTPLFKELEENNE